MKRELYDQFKLLQSRGERAEAKDVIKQFILSFESFEEKRSFSEWFFSNDFDRIVRHELYESVIFPVLVDGYRKKDPWSIRQLAKTAQNLYKAEFLWEQVGHTTALKLLREYVKLCPNDSSARLDLLDELIKFFGHCEHEWPAGILYGMDGATDDECLTLLSTISEVRDLDIERRYADYINEFEIKVNSYRERIIN